MATLATRYADVHVAVGPRRRGVFAARAIAAGEGVEVCPTLRIPGDDVNGLLCDYIFDSGDEDGTAVFMLGYGMLYNHSATPNLEYYERETGFISFEAVQSVDAG